ncbi:MAG: type II and III secretion system protein [Thiomicrospira sp.]|uniref:type II secretion system protein GspD n=1 Tax=Thiomicrospira sp. TaxID=935 RepID=UPI001A107815|nr:type II and III secretion system protein [Thiomicrospira sp.]MBE0492945.1 type II and III secretion system protein [Thiomicrospira sp.]
MKNFRVHLVILLSLLFGLVACSGQPVNNNDRGLETANKPSVTDGHLTAQSRPIESISDSSVPSIVSARAYNIPPKPEVSLPSYSLTAFDAPVHEIIYRLSEMSGYEVDIWPGVEGKLTINAINQPLKSILKRISDQLDLIVDVDKDLIQVKPDKAYWKHYRIDYVNIKRSSRDSIVMNMTVGGSVNPTQGGQSTGSRSSVEVASVHDFWSTLRSSLLSMTYDRTTRPGGSSITAGQANVLNVAQSPDLTGSFDSGSNVNPNRSIQNNSSTVVINPEAGLVLVYATNKRHHQVQHYIDSITQRSERQVMIEASVVEVVLSENHQSGIDWSTSGFRNLSNREALMALPGAEPMADNVFTATLGNDVGLDLNVGLKALEEYGDVQVLSSPKIMAVNNQTALLKVVDNQVYFTIDVSRSTSTAGTDVTYSTSVHTVPVGFMMSMTPFVSDQREVSLNIRPTISRIIGRVNDPNPDLFEVGAVSSIPIVQEREMETVLKLRDMQTAVIGGLIEDRQDNLESGLPWLSRIPIFGNLLFGYSERKTSKTELVIFIRPIIVDRPDIESGDLKSFRSLLEKRTGASE